MDPREEAEELLRRAVGNPAARFRAGQWEAIQTLVHRRGRLLVVERTGWGKSSVYFIATRLMRNAGAGPTLIVSPLLALMRNQLDAAARLGLTARTINSTNRGQWKAILADLQANRVDVLLISPERLANESFVRDALIPAADRIGLLVVDEAHCISDWGHDFRPDYRRLSHVLRRLPPHLPILATTATANDRVVQDVAGQLGTVEVRRGPLMRETLSLQTLRLPDAAARLAWLAEHVPQLPGAGIIYALTRGDAVLVANWLRQKGVRAFAYHSSVSPGHESESPEAEEYRESLERSLLDNRVKALVATTALGMGFDKPDLGFVVHYQAPGSIIAYYQQVGRAGRAIPSAFGVLLSGEEDDDIHAFFRRHAFPTETHVHAVLRLLEDSDGLTRAELERHVNLRSEQLEKVLKYLAVCNPAPLLLEEGVWRRTPVPFELDHAQIRRLTRQREAEWREVQSYFQGEECLMQRLARSLDDVHSTECGRCDRCRRAPVVSPEVSPALLEEARRFLETEEIRLYLRSRVPDGSFPEYGFEGEMPAELRGDTGRVLCRWGHGVWGRAVAKDKRLGRFREELVEAAVALLAQRWRPVPPPQWIACVPSSAHPRLMPEFCLRLSRRLGIPFHPALVKVKVNQPQKEQQNRAHQCRNLDGVFQVAGVVPTGPVLLLDDTVDSGWTLTVSAALLRRAGCERVWPLALSSTSGT